MMPTLPLDSTDYPRVFHHLLTGVMLLDDAFNILTCNATLEQMLSASVGQIVQADIFAILQVVEKSEKTPEKAENANAKILNKTPSLRQQFEHCRAMHQAFIHYDVLIQGIHEPILVDYGVSPIDDEQGFFYIIEVWEKDCQNR